MDRLYSQLRDWQEKGTIAFHMPGHKRNSVRFPELGRLGARFDVTEIPGFDDLHDPEGLIKEAQARCARLYGAQESFFCVNGSTGGILAGIRAATRRGDRVLVARNCHKAVYHALELCGLRPVFLQPPLTQSLCAGSLPAETVESAFAEYPDLRLLILTSPTYEGILSDLPRICAVAHAHNVPVFVDEAHGAHLGFGAGFPDGAGKAGADLVVQSFHKTLPSLTQTAVVHRHSDRISRDELQRQLGIFQTSSPSYLFLASLELCVEYLEQDGDTLFAEWSARLARFRAQVAGLQHLRLFSKESGVFALDPSKLVIVTAGSGLGGVALAARLREEYRIEVEMALEPYVVAMTGMGDTSEQLDALAAALLEIDQSCPGGASVEMVPQDLPESVCSLEDALALPWELRPAQEAAQGISAASIWIYPPGIPLLLPGERLSADLLAYIEHARNLGLRVISTRGDLSKGFALLCDDFADKD